MLRNIRNSICCFPLLFLPPARGAEGSNMVIKDVPFMLKDGREALLRSPREEDIESTLE